MWYSFDYGPVHFLSFSTETDYPGAPIDLKKREYAQLDWIAQDLAGVNRSNTPFVIAFAHRPFYVQVPKHDQKQPAKIKQVFEPIFHKGQVDLFFAGHTHMYQRTKRVYQDQLDESGLITIVAGGGGGLEGLSKFPAEDLVWIAAEYNATESYGTLEANQTHLLWKAFASPKSGPVGALIDEVVIDKRF
jgi:hypothetical protein